VPRLVNYSGMLQDASGEPVTDIRSKVAVISRRRDQLKALFSEKIAVLGN